jgi:hypothetical protein
MNPISKFFKDVADATGASRLYADWKAHTAEVRRAQENFQRQMQWKVDNHGLQRLEEDEKRAREARRAARRKRWGL